MERCDAVLLQCILECPTDDTNCLSGCIRDGIAIMAMNVLIVSNSYYHLNWLSEQPFKLIFSPCELNCLEGCTDCENPVCQCEVSLKSNYILIEIFC